VKALTALLLILPAAGQSRFEQFSRDVATSARQLHIADLRIAVIESGRVSWQKGRIKAQAPKEPVIAERISQTLLDTAAPGLSRATIRQVLMNMADGTPGEEILENRALFEALHTVGAMPNAVAFAKKEHATLGWFVQDYRGQRVLWSYDPSVLVVSIPGKKLALVVSADSTTMTQAARSQDGNVARSTIALAFFKDVAGLGDSERDELIDRALIALYFGDRDSSAALVRQALDKFPELESTPDVTLLYLFSRLGLPETDASATAVIKAHPSLPTAWFYYGQYLENSKRYREAAACFEKITEHEPPWHHWTVTAAKKELPYLKTY
jgi:hypothetical protein